MSLKHKHLILALDVKWPPKDAVEAKHFLAFLIKRVDMAIAASPELTQNPMGYYCNLAGNEGVTAVGILETSHCALHSWNLDSPAKFQFDLYSCKEFDVPYIISLCNSFGIIGGTYLVIDRDSKLKVLEQGVLGEDGVIIVPDRIAA
jgi:hypothetical protein